MDDKFLIHLDIAEKSYGLWIDRKDEQLARDAAKQIRNKINQYRQNFAQSDVGQCCDGFQFGVGGAEQPAAPVEIANERHCGCRG